MATRPIALACRGAARLLPSLKATPLATTTVIVLLVSNVLLRTHPADVDAVVAWASTNVDNLGRHPVAAMLVSAFVVPGSLFPALVLVGVALAALERAIGVRHTVVIAISGQVIATLLTEYGADLGAHLHLLIESPADRPDVGVSYVMYSVLAASVLLFPGKAGVVGLMAVTASVLPALLSSPGMTTTGHLLCIGLGAATMAALRHRRRVGFRPWRGSRSRAGPTVRETC